MTVIKITHIQYTAVLNQHELKEIATLTVDHKFERLRRVFNVPMKDDEEYPVWIDLMADNGYDLLDEQITISASNALWLLRDFYSAPKKYWSKIKEAN